MARGIIDYFSDDLPTLGKIRRHNGVAGQIAYSVPVTYPDEDTSVVTFVGSAYGGPVIMQTVACPQGVFVRDVERFGSFGPDWVRRFFDGEV
jgi:hypothetical protein